MKCDDCKYFDSTNNPSILADGICRIDGLFVDREEEHECCRPVATIEEMRALIGGVK